MNEKEYKFYEQIKDWNFSDFKIDVESLTNWDLYEELKKLSNNDSKILDLGTGGGEKVLEQFPDVSEILGTDLSEAMIETANKNLLLSGKKNITFRKMDNLNMDTPLEYFDIVVARNTVTDPKQIYLTLKKDGYLLIHGVDKYDCHELKRIFGKGQSYFDKKPISIIDYENMLDAGFKDVELIPIHKREYFSSKQDLVNFLLKVPIIEDFNVEDKDFYKKNIDHDKLNEYIKRNTYKKGIRLIRRYYGIIGKK